jgi:hypothetical protein
MIYSGDCKVILFSQQNVFSIAESRLLCEMKLSGEIKSGYKLSSDKFVVLLQDLSLVTISKDPEGLRQQASVLIYPFRGIS